MSEQEKTARQNALEESKNGYVQHVNKTSSGKFYVSDWYDCDCTVVSYENGKEL